MNFVEGLLLAAHVLVAIGICGFVLLQHGKGADMGAAFGSGAQDVLQHRAGLHDPRRNRASWSACRPRPPTFPRRRHRLRPGRPRRRRRPMQASRRPRRKDRKREKCRSKLRDNAVDSRRV